jgi:sugar phosphate isomerase/epimerase
VGRAEAPAQRIVYRIAPMTSAAPRISVFPKCYLDELVSGQRSYIGWIDDAATLGAEGLEHYDQFFASDNERDVAPVVEAMARTSQISSMLCFSPDFTHPDPDERRRQVALQKRAIDLTVRLGARHCRTLSGQKYPGLSIEEGVARAASCIAEAVDYAISRDVVLCLENHYKVGEWKYPEFAQQEAPFLALLDALPESPHFGVQYDPSNAVVGGFDPIAFLDRIKHRVVTVHASDRFVAPGATLDELRAHDGTIGYPDRLIHGETGGGANDYDAIFRLLRSAGFTGWISIEDGMNGLDELRRSVQFLKEKRAQYYGASGA